MMIGAGRMYEAACALSFDKHLHPTIDQTIIVSPYSFVTLGEEFLKFKINTNNFIFYKDSELIEKFSLQEWAKNHWYLQQGIKLHLIDTLSSDFLIQDCDVFAFKPYNFFAENKPVFRVEELWNDYQYVYAEKVKKLLGMERQIPYSFVTEFMPYLKKDWQTCKELIENKHQCFWQKAIFSLDKFNETKWLSEYEILGIYKTNKDNDYHIIKEYYPEVYSMQDLTNADWSNTDTVKFKAKPFKYMGQQPALTIRDFFIRKENDRII